MLTGELPSTLANRRRASSHTAGRHNPAVQSQTAREPWKNKRGQKKKAHALGGPWAAAVSYMFLMGFLKF
jgi:hypothetical protein